MSESAEEFLETLSELSSDLMLIDDPDDPEVDSVVEGLESIRERFSVLKTLEDDTDQIETILGVLDDLLAQLADFSSGEAGDPEQFLEELRSDLTDLEGEIRDYGESIDGGTDDTDAEEGTSAEGTEEDLPDSIPPHDELAELEYRDLQELAKNHDVKANQGAEELVSILDDLRETPEEDDHEESDPDRESSSDEDSPDGPENGELVTDPGDYDEEMFYDFFSEATEHLDAFEDVLLELEQERDMDALNRGFRGMHSIKGAAGFLDLRWVNNLSHAMEDLLGLFRDDGYVIEEQHVDLLFDALDSLKKLINLHHETVETGETRSLNEKQFNQEIKHVRSAIEALEESGETVDDSQREEPKDEEESEDVELRETESIRVDTEKIDTIVNRAGELVTTFNQLKRGEEQSNGEQTREQRQMYNQMDRIVSDLQEEALSLRMVPLKKTFGKTRRLVRDLSKEFGKEVNLVIEGEDTELDRSLVEKIQDPLVHLVRNAMDHGIETPKERREKGKDEEGTLKISAYHESGDVIIEISDDGAGIDPDGILEKARNKDLVDSGEQLSEQEIYMLLFEPGFSTSEEVTDVSGRGVGMDVVRKNVESIRGSIEVESEIDDGTTFRLKIPLTLSIINGMIMKLGDQRFVIPTTNILRSLSPDPAQITTVEGRGEVLQLRGELISLCRLNQLFELDVDDRPFSESLVVIVKGGGQKVGLQVDDILGQQEMVIKSLGLAFDSLKGVSGAAILGDGEVGLILDTQTLEKIVD